MAQRSLTIHFVDGSQLAVSFPPQVPLSMLSATVRDAIEAKELALEVDGRLMIVQMANVKYLLVDPAPESLPSNVVRGATLE